MTRIDIDKKNNCFHIVLSGSFDVNDARSTLKEVQFKVEEIQPEFDVITDIRFLKFADMGATRLIKQGTDVLINHGAKRIIRVVGGSSFALKLFARFSKVQNKNVELYYVGTLEEAQEMVQSPMSVY